MLSSEKARKLNHFITECILGVLLGRTFTFQLLVVLLANVSSSSEVLMELFKPNRLEDAMLVVLAENTDKNKPSKQAEKDAHLLCLETKTTA